MHSLLVKELRGTLPCCDDLDPEYGVDDMAPELSYLSMIMRPSSFPSKLDPTPQRESFSMHLLHFHECLQLKHKLDRIANSTSIWEFV